LKVVDVLKALGNQCVQTPMNVKEIKIEHSPQT
jgi:hypothetical protein